MGWAVKLEKDWFVGKRALVRKQETPTEKLIAYRGDSGSRKAPWEGAAVKVDGKLVGRVTSSWYSWSLGIRSASPGSSPSSPTRAGAS